MKVNKNKIKGKSILIESNIDVDSTLGKLYRESYLEENRHGFKKVNHVHKNKKKYDRKRITPY